MVLHEVEPPCSLLQRRPQNGERERTWSEMPSSADMEQVKELLGLIKVVKTNGGLVAASFIVHRI